MSEGYTKCPGGDWEKGPGEPFKVIATESEAVPGWVRCQVLRQEDTEQAGEILWEVTTSPSQHRTSFVAPGSERITG